MDAQQPILNRPRAVHTVWLGGLAAGLLDGLDAIVFFGLRGAKAEGIFQYIASGLLGPSSFSRGALTVALGVVLHFTVAIILAGIFHVAAVKVPALLRRPLLSGAVFGLIAYATMNYAVIPLSAAPRTSGFSLPVFLNGIFAHIVLVGWPIALVASWSARRRSVRDSPSQAEV